MLARPGRAGDADSAGLRWRCWLGRAPNAHPNVRVEPPRRRGLQSPPAPCGDSRETEAEAGETARARIERHRARDHRARHHRETALFRIGPPRPPLNRKRGAPPPPTPPPSPGQDGGAPVAQRGGAACARAYASRGGSNRGPPEPGAEIAFFFLFLSRTSSISRCISCPANCPIVLLPVP